MEGHLSFPVFVVGTGQSVSILLRVILEQLGLAAKTLGISHP